MRRIAAFTLLAASSSAFAACATPDPYMAISDAPGPLSAPHDDADWSQSSGGSGYFPPGTVQFPAIVSLRVEGRRPDGDFDVNDPLSNADLEIIDGSACRLSEQLACAGGICFAELELTGEGLCMLRATGVTRDGNVVQTCWYRGTWEQDPADPELQVRMDRMAENAYESCLGPL